MAGKPLESRQESGVATRAPSAIADRDLELGWVLDGFLTQLI